MATTPADQPNGPSHGAPDGAVVVGIDGREQDRATLTWAAREALSRNAPVHIISAIDMDLPLLSSGEAVPLAMVEEQLQVDLGRRLQEAAEQVMASAPGTAVSAYSASGKASSALLAAGETAALIVLGSASAGRLQRIFLGSTSTSVVGLAACPVVVVGAAPPETGDVVAAFDGSAPALAALEYAAATAARLGVGLRVVSVWFLEVVDGIVAADPESPQFASVQQRYGAKVEAAVAPLRARYADLVITAVVRQGRAVDVLTEESRTAQLLVCGRRGRGLAATLLGSVSRKLLQSAEVPVAVVRGPQD